MLNTIIYYIVILKKYLHIKTVTVLFSHNMLFYNIGHKIKDSKICLNSVFNIYHH